MTASLPRRFRVGLLSLGLFLLGGSVVPTCAQDLQDLVVPSVTNTYAIENARVVQAPGQVLESATVVVRDGLIEAVGSDVKIPYDARRIKGDSLVVYAGFIDGLSHAGVKMPDSDSDAEAEDGENGSEVDPGNPPPDRAGIQPDRSVRRFLSPDASSLSERRKVGFTTGHVVPKGEMLPGSGAYVFYGGETVDDMMLEPNSTLFAQIKPAEGYVYPATDMAVIAQFRQLYREAARRQKLQAAYEKNPEGPRPPRDPIHSAFFPVLNGEKPLFFYADGALTIHRVLALKKELDFPLMIAGLGESFRTVDDLQNVEAPLFLTLDLPKRSPAQDTTVADTTDQPAKYYNPDLRTQSYRDVPEEEKNLELRHAMARQKYLETAATLHEAGLTFGFSTREVDPGDVRKNLRTMIENGLPKQAALAALTTRPAHLLGLSTQLGTVEEGKIANLVVTDGPYFAEGSKVRHVFVDGQPYHYTSDGGEKGSVSGDVSAVLGTWTYTLSTPQGEFTGTFTIEGDQSGLTGTFTGPQGDTQEMQSLSFDGTTLSFSVESPQGGTASITGTVKQDTFEGTVSTPGGSFSITGERTST
ncbi:MAG: amidohydrolase family protein, partial [Salinibacter sp.]